MSPEIRLPSSLGSKSSGERQIANTAAVVDASSAVDEPVLTRVVDRGSKKRLRADVLASKTTEGNVVTWIQILSNFSRRPVSLSWVSSWEKAHADVVAHVQQWQSESCLIHIR